MRGKREEILNTQLRGAPYGLQGLHHMLNSGYDSDLLILRVF